jgi:hypothetical protein
MIGAKGGRRDKSNHRTDVLKGLLTQRNILVHKNLHRLSKIEIGLQVYFNEVKPWKIQALERKDKI